MPQTPNHNYNVPSRGDQNWHQPVNDNFQQFDTDIEIRDYSTAIDEYEPKEGAKFHATDTGDIYIGDGQQWNVLSGGRASGSTPTRTDMPRPSVTAYAEFKDSGGNPIEGSTQGLGQRGMIEVLGFEHSVLIPTDLTKGELMGVRQHRPATLVMPYDKSTPLLYDALTNGETLQEVIIHWPFLDANGNEVEYFRHTFKNAKVAEITSIGMSPQQAVSILYSEVTWLYLDGNIEYTDSWTAER